MQQHRTRHSAAFKARIKLGIKLGTLPIYFVRPSSFLGF